jgi:hypothetical protein
MMISFWVFVGVQRRAALEAQARPPREKGNG